MLTNAQLGISYIVICLIYAVIQSYILRKDLKQNSELKFTILGLIEGLFTFILLLEVNFENLYRYYVIGLVFFIVTMQIKFGEIQSEKESSKWLMRFRIILIAFGLLILGHI